MQRTTFRHVSVVARCIVFAATLMMSEWSSAQAVDYVCEGALRTDNVFEAGGVTTETRRFRISANIAAGYVKRDPALAAGCFAGRTEVCACEPPSSEKIVCRSLGFRADGTEVSLDFTLRHSERILNVVGKEFNPGLGTLIEVQGELICTRSPAVSTP
jgi:hypothetical protein